MKFGDYQQIEKLILKYVTLVDEGDFKSLGDMFEDAKFIAPPVPKGIKGAAAVTELFTSAVKIYEDGTPKTQHLMSNIDITPVTKTRATAESCLTVYQATDSFPLQPILTSRYTDEFVREHGQWRFKKRFINVVLTGDVSHHLKNPEILD